MWWGSLEDSFVSCRLIFCSRTEWRVIGTSNVSGLLVAASDSAVGVIGRCQQPFPETPCHFFRSCHVAGPCCQMSSALRPQSPVELNFVAVHLICGFVV